MDKGDDFDGGDLRGCILGLGQYCGDSWLILIVLGDVDMGSEDTAKGPATFGDFI